MFTHVNRLEGCLKTVKIAGSHCADLYALVGLGWAGSCSFVEHRARSHAGAAQSVLGGVLSPLVTQFWSLHNLAIVYFSSSIC